LLQPTPARSERQSLERENERLSSEVERLQRELAECDKELEEDEKLIAEDRKQIADQERQPTLRRQNSTTFSKPPFSDRLAATSARLRHFQTAIGEQEHGYALAEGFVESRLNGLWDAAPARDESRTMKWTRSLRSWKRPFIPNRRG
jgi:chromosome segregation ATPase